MSIFTLMQQAIQEGRVGECGVCHRPHPLTNRGRLFAHAGPPVQTGPYSYTATPCSGAGTEAVRLTPDALPRDLFGPGARAVDTSALRGPVQGEERSA